MINPLKYRIIKESISQEDMKSYLHIPCMMDLQYIKKNGIQINPREEHVKQV
jgi:hypothetical protein